MPGSTWSDAHSLREGSRHEVGSRFAPFGYGQNPFGPSTLSTLPLDLPDHGSFLERHLLTGMEIGGLLNPPHGGRLLDCRGTTFPTGMK